MVTQGMKNQHRPEDMDIENSRAGLCNVATISKTSNRFARQNHVRVTEPSIVIVPTNNPTTPRTFWSTGTRKKKNQERRKIHEGSHSPDDMEELDSRGTVTPGAIAVPGNSVAIRTNSSIDFTASTQHQQEDGDVVGNDDDQILAVSNPPLMAVGQLVNRKKSQVIVDGRVIEYDRTHDQKCADIGGYSLRTVVGFLFAILVLCGGLVGLIVFFLGRRADHSSAGK